MPYTETIYGLLLATLIGFLFGWKIRQWIDNRKLILLSLKLQLKSEELEALRSGGRNRSAQSSSEVSEPTGDLSWDRTEEINSLRRRLKMLSARRTRRPPDSQEPTVEESGGAGPEDI